MKKHNSCLYCGTPTSEIFCCLEHQTYYRRRNERNNRKCLICNNHLLPEQESFCSDQCKELLETAKQTGKALNIRIDSNTIILTKKYDKIIEIKQRIQEQRASLSIRKKVPLIKDDSEQEQIMLS